MKRRWTNEEKLTAGALGVAAVGGLWWLSRPAATLPSGALKQPVPVSLLPQWATESMPVRHDADLVPLKATVSSGAVVVDSPGLLKGSPKTLAWPPFQPSLPTVRPSTIDALLETCPTATEIAEINRDFPNISIDKSVSTMGSCTLGGDESSVTLMVYNCFRCFRALTFDAPLPLFGTRNLYEWMRGQGLTFRFIVGSGSEGRDRVLTMGLPPPTFMPYMRQWDGPANGATGLSSMMGLMVHEARHATSGLAHNCQPRGIDTSLAYGGAWAAQYWFDRWCAEHAGAALSSPERAAASERAETIRASAFCEAA